MALSLCLRNDCIIGFMVNRNFFCGLIFFLSSFLACGISQAEEMIKWHLITDKREAIPLDHVDFIISSDNEFDKFCIVTIDGEIISEVSEISFQELDTSGITTPQSDSEEISIGDSVIKIIFNQNKKGESIHIYDLTGKRMIGRTIDGSYIEISISTLSPGIYILNVAGRSLKFRKR